MKVAKLRTAIFVSQDPNSTFAEHRCFLNPRHSTDHEVFNPEVIVQTKDWECRLSKPTVGYELLGFRKHRCSAKVELGSCEAKMTVLSLAIFIC